MRTDEVRADRVIDNRFDALAIAVIDKGRILEDRLCGYRSRVLVGEACLSVVFSEWYNSFVVFLIYCNFLF
jgi:hypothetical protein